MEIQGNPSTHYILKVGKGVSYTGLCVLSMLMLVHCSFLQTSLFKSSKYGYSHFGYFVFFCIL